MDTQNVSHFFAFSRWAPIRRGQDRGSTRGNSCYTRGTQADLGGSERAPAPDRNKVISRLATLFLGSCRARIVTAFRLFPAPLELNVIRLVYPKALASISSSIVVALFCLGSAPAPSLAQDPAAQRLYQEAERLLSAGDVKAAQAEFSLLVRQFPQDKLAPKALLTQIDLYRSTGESQEVRAALDKLLTEYARTEEAASGFLIQAETKVESARTLPDLESARAIFRRVPLLFGIESYPDLAARSRARIRGGELALLAGDLAAAEAEFVAVVEDEPNSSYTGRARLLLGRTLLMKGELAAGVGDPAAPVRGSNRHGIRPGQRPQLAFVGPPTSLAAPGRGSPIGSRPSAFPAPVSPCASPRAWPQLTTARS